TRYGHPTVTLAEDILIFGSDIVRIKWAKGAGLLGTKPVDTPTDLNPDLWNETAIIWKTRQSTKYRRLVGNLIYLFVTRLGTFCSQPSQFMDKPQSVQWDDALRILKYIKTSPGKGLLFKQCGHVKIEAYSHADYVGYKDGRKSTYIALMLAGIWCLGVAKNKLQSLDRAQKAEYRAMAQTTIEILWLKNLLKELGFTYNDPHLCIVILFSIRGQTILKLTVISSMRLS
ncbi:hypothetical protein Sango_2666100, partial [Sesamum angolense]